MRRSTLAAIFMLAPTLAGAQSLGDQDSSGRFDGMPAGTDRYRDDSSAGSFSIPLGAAIGEHIVEPQGTMGTCVHPLKSSRNVTPTGVARASCR